jgi:hypothetical protein
VAPVAAQTATNTTQIAANTDAIAQLVSTGFKGTWSSAISYSQGATVIYGGSLYEALLDSTNQQPNTSPTFWQLLSSGSIYKGTWSNVTSYSVGDQVSYQGNFYIAIVAQSGNTPSPASASPWILVGTSAVLIGAYSGATAYVAGNEVTNAGNIFQALQATTGNAPPTPPATNAFWQLIGPSSLDNIADGSTKFGQTGNGLSYRPTSNPLTGTDAGASATINIAAWVNRTGSKGDISYNSGSITALSYSTLYYLYFDDPSLAGGSPTYIASTAKATAANGAGRFFLGSIYTPKSGGVSTVGFNDGGNGATGGKSLIGGPGTQVVTTSGSSVPTFSTFGSSMSGDQSLFDTLTSTGTSNTKSLTYVVSNFGFSNQNYTALSLNVKSALPTNGLIGSGAKWVISYSLNGGITFTTLRTVNAGSTYSVTIDTVNLDLRQNLAAVQVKYVMQLATSDTLGAITANIYTPQILGND